MLVFGRCGCLLLLWVGLLGLAWVNGFLRECQWTFFGLWIVLFE